MVIPEFSISFIIALILTGLYMVVRRGAGRKTGLIWLFLVIFLATWAGGTWLRPFGPTLWGIHWPAFLLVGVVIVLFLIVAVPPKAPRGRQETLDMLERIEEKKEIEEVVYITLSISLWILLSLLLIAIILRYVIGMKV
jgi:hypothetical protein